MVQQLLQTNPNHLAELGLRDETVLKDLSNFCNNLRTSIDSVQKQQRQEENEAAAKTRMDAKRDKEKEAFQSLLASNRCFECDNQSSVGVILSPCACFENEAVSWGGVMLCDSWCEDKQNVGSCMKCDKFLCKESWDPSYKCKSCEEIMCLDCAENSNGKTGDIIGQSCEGSIYGWHCEDCAEDCITKESACCKCGEGRALCHPCNELRSINPPCDGDCEQPLCDDCVCTLACGNDVRLCGECDFDCADCDMCAGYYEYRASRWG